MPYKTTKNRLVNEVTLGDGYPLSNNLQPLKVGGETSPLEMSKQLPDESNKAKVKVVGDLEVTGNVEVTGETSGVVSASDTVKGVVELATTAETTTGTDATRAVTPDGLMDGFEGSTILNTLGEVATGSWEADAIENDYIANLPTSKITSGTFADARIAASNVTQHQASLTGTGALNAGSITSGFTSIDTGSGAITTTGTLTGGNGVCGGPSTPTKHFADWHYYSANLATQNAYYNNSPVDDFGVTRNTDITDNDTTTLSNAWRMIRYARRVPYGGELTKFQAMIESTGAAADSDIEVSLWWADNLSDDTEYASTQDFTVDRLCTLTFDFSSATQFMTKQTTSFDEATIAEGDWLFVTLRKITSGDGSSFNAVVNALWTGA